MLWIDVYAEFIVSAAEVLDERVSGANHSGGAEPCQAAHRPPPRLQPSMIGFDRVVGVLLDNMAGGGHQFIDNARVSRNAT